MELDFASASLRKRMEDNKAMSKAFGERAKPLRLRLALLRQAANLADVSHVPPPRRHRLTGDRDGQYAVDLKHPWRLVFEPANDPLPVLDDGSLDLAAVTRVRILDVTDYH
jgi:proteic killer suppression protein